MTIPLAAGIKAGLLLSGWYRRELVRDRLPGVLVLCYHGVRPPSWRHDESAFPNLHVALDTFENHCRIIADICHPISLDDWRAALANRRRLPDRPVLVTFDDGYRSVFDVARPVLRRFRIPAAVFVCSEPIRRQRLFWFDALARLRGEAAVAQFRTLGRHDFAENLASTQIAAQPDDPLAPMTIDQVKTLAHEGFEIGVHTATHAPLAGASRDLQRAEIEGCRDTLMEWLRRPVTALAYPWGAPRVDYTSETVALAETLGFQFGFTTVEGFARRTEQPLERSRVLVLSEVTASELAHRITYAWR